VDYQGVLKSAAKRETCGVNENQINKTASNQTTFKVSATEERKRINQIISLRINKPVQIKLTKEC
jgi:hypothetical protein